MRITYNTLTPLCTEKLYSYFPHFFLVITVVFPSAVSSISATSYASPPATFSAELFLYGV